jgi:predicted acyltransferase
MVAPAASASPGTLASTLPSQAARMVSLDIFRGMTIAAMILVNDPGTWSAIYWPLDHAEWNGWTPTDLIFPFFLFIVGVSMTLSFAARLRRGATRGQLARHVAIRGLAIFAIGLFLNGFPYFHLATIRYAGVLQRIAVCYLIAGLLALATAKRADREAFQARIGVIAAVIAALLIGYWALMRFVPVPGYGVGRLDPDGNLAAYIDRLIMHGHTWRPMWDPEGFLSTIPAIGTALAGVLVGEWLRGARTPQRKFAGMITVGAVVLLAGRLLHPFFPINKNLWTSTFVIFTAGFAMVVLGLCYWVADIRGWRKWAMPFLVFGTNAIAAYAISALIAKSSVVFHVNAAGRQTTWHGYVYTKFFATLAQPKDASLIFAIFFVLLCFIPAWLLYRRRIFIKV